MNIKCNRCSSPLMSFSNYLFKNISKEGVECSESQAILVRNELVFVIPFLATLISNNLLNALGEPKYISALVSLSIAAISIYILASVKPLSLKPTKKTKNKPTAIKWYTSPILYLSLFTILFLFLLLK